MKVIRERGMQSGFILHQPSDPIPALAHINEVVCGPDYHLGTHVHGCHEFHYLSKGELVWKVGKARHPQKAGELFVIGPGVEHELEPTGRRGKSFHAFSMGLDLRRWGENLDKGLLNKVRDLEQRTLGRAQEFEPVLRAIFRFCLRKGDGRDRIVLGYIGLFLLLLAEWTNDMDGAETSPSNVYSFPVEKALRYMQENVDRRIPLKELARVSHLTCSHFASRFRKETGLSPIAHHLAMRLEAAREALGSPEADLTEVALSHGFSSLQHFSARFSRAYGVPPGQWRKTVFGP